MPAWLVTGGSGFLGQHLLDQLGSRRPQGVEVVSMGRRLVELDRWPGVTHQLADLDDLDRLIPIIASLRPDVVFHLAGRTPPANSSAFYRSNTLATVHLLDALRVLDRPTRLVLVGSAAELGPVPLDSLPVAEDYPSRPLGPYGLSKWLATVAGLAARPPLEVIIARIFNPIGPGLPPNQALGRFAQQLASGSGPSTLSVGGLDARRDFIDVRDVASALVLLASQGEPGRVYHVGLGRSERVGDALEQLIGWSGREVTLEVDAQLAKNTGPADSRANTQRIVEATGWAPRFTWEQSLRDLWDEALRRSSPMSESG